MDSICRFIPAKSGGDLKTVHFVYETEFRKMKQPFLYPIYYMHLVTRGKAVMKLLSKSFPLEVGTIYFAFPGIPYEIEGSEDFTYMYISFMGLRAGELMTELKIAPSLPIMTGFEGEIPFWKSAIQRIRQQNANILAESVLLYTLSFVDSGSDANKPHTSNILENIISFTDNNYMDPDLSLTKIADIFSYTDKYLSHLFKVTMNMNFSNYLTRLRVQHAIDLIGNGEDRIDRIAAACGYRDPAYFSKIFKRCVGKTPNLYIKAQKNLDTQ